MGRLVSTRAKNDGHEVSVVLTSRDATRSAEELDELLSGHDAAIDFSVADAVLANVTSCVRARYHSWKELPDGTIMNQKCVALLMSNDGSLIYGANFSIGVNLFYGIVSRWQNCFSACRTMMRLSKKHTTRANATRHQVLR